MLMKANYVYIYVEKVKVTNEVKKSTRSPTQSKCAKLATTKIVTEMADVGKH